MKATILTFFTILIMIKAQLDSFTHKSCADYDPTQSGSGAKQAYSKDFCRTLSYDSSKKCCFFKYKGEDGYNYYNCLELDYTEFLDIDKTIKSLNYNVKSLECDSSSYLYGSLLLLLIFLF